MQDITEIDVKNFNGLIKYLRGLTEDGVTPLIEKQVKLMLDNCINFFSHLVIIESFPELKRLTINRNVLGSNKRIREIQHLKYPPAEKVKKYGRCNLPGQSVLYSAFDILTVLNELKPQKGDLISQSTWRLKNNQTLKCCPIFRNQPPDKEIINPRTYKLNQLFEKKVSDFPPNIQKQIKSLVQFIADSYSQKIDSGNHLDYIFSAYFSDKIFSQFEEGTIEAIFYPSVQQSG